MGSLRYFCIQRIFTFFVSLYKGLSEFLQTPLTWETFSTCLIALDNLQEVLKCSILTDFRLTMFEFSKFFVC